MASIRLKSILSPSDALKSRIRSVAVVVDSATRADLDLTHRRLWGVATSAEELGLAPFDEAADQARVLVAVKLANTAAGDLTHTQLQGYALHAAASTAEPLDLLWATCWWDVRED